MFIPQLMVYVMGIQNSTYAVPLSVYNSMSDVSNGCNAGSHALPTLQK